MTVKELIAELQRQVNAGHGDLDVIDDSDSPVQAVEFNDDNNDPVVCIIFSD